MRNNCIGRPSPKSVNLAHQCSLSLARDLSIALSKCSLQPLSLMRLVKKGKVSKVSIITQFYPPDHAATGQLIEELAKQLSRQGLEIQILTGQPGYGKQQKLAPPRENQKPIAVRRSLTSRFWPQRFRGRAINGLLFCFRSGLRLLKPSYRGDVLLLTTEPPYLLLVGYLAKLFFNLPYVCLLYDLYPDVAVSLNVISEKHWLTRFWNWVNGKVWRNAQGIIVLSSTMKDRVVAKYPDLANQITVIHSWSDPDYILPKPKQENPFAIKYNLVKPFTVLYSGNMGRCHDLETIMATAWELKEEPIQFVFIGGGAKYDDCYRTIMEQWQLKNCLFLPFQPKKDLPNSLTACDLSLVTISEGMEGLVAPSKLYGILAAGRAVAAVCEGHSYLCELLQKAGCGQTFLNGDSKGLADYIRFLSAHPKQVETMGEAGRRYLETHFTPEVIAKEYAKVLLGSSDPSNSCSKTKVEQLT